MAPVPKPEVAFCFEYAYSTVFAFGSFVALVFVVTKAWYGVLILVAPPLVGRRPESENKKLLEASGNWYSLPHTLTIFPIVKTTLHHPKNLVKGSFVLCHFWLICYNT